jgi:phosphatidylserine/phosphatidylglycerophosphate/cardiolipin synthase-like enzyme
VSIDAKPAIAHSKVMIFDGAAVFTGSYNFTRSAEERNAENGVLIRGDAALVRAYQANWQARSLEALPYAAP